MFTEYAAIVGGFVLLSVLGGSALLLGRRWRQSKPGLCLLIVLLTLSLPSFALERRHQDFITVPASETIDDTLLAAGNTVRVEGVINGDLLAFAQTVEVRGTVKGDMVSFAKRIVVSGMWKDTFSLVRGRWTWMGNWATASTAGRSLCMWGTGVMWVTGSWLELATSSWRVR